MTMKYTLVALIMSLNVQAASYEVVNPIDVNGWKATDRDAVVELIQNSVYKKVVLDCDSFLHGLTLTSDQSSNFFMLHESECDKLWKLVKEDADQQASSCMLVDFDTGTLEYLQNQKCTQN